MKRNFDVLEFEERLWANNRIPYVIKEDTFGESVYNYLCLFHVLLVIFWSLPKLNIHLYLFQWWIKNICNINDYFFKHYDFVCLVFNIQLLNFLSIWKRLKQHDAHSTHFKCIIKHFENSIVLWANYQTENENKIIRLMNMSLCPL